MVDGKQRLETILLFANDELRISSEFGNSDLSGKKFSELSRDYKRVFWNYPMTVEQFEQFEGATVNQIFDRLNRNTHKLTRQELRHAQFGGEFITFVEADAETYFWSEVGISTKARARRMKDIEFIAELFVLTINGIVGSDADGLDEYFGKYDEEVPDFEKNKEKFELVKRNISNINQYHNIEESRYKNFADFYSLFASILEKLPNQINAELTADNLKMFEVQLRILSEDESNLSAESLPIEVLDITKYERAVRGASSDINPRRDRAEVIGKLLVMSQ